MAYSSSTIKDKANDSANYAANETVSTLRGAEHDIRETAERLGREARDAVDHVVTSAQSATTQVRQRIEGQPVQSSLIALASGFVLGMLFSKR